MFDIAFTELLVIGVVALLVIGPERLPKVARTAGSWMGKLNRYAAQIKSDVDREMKLDELKKLQAEMQSTAQKYELMAAEAEVKMKREMTAAERLALAVGVNDSSGAAETKQALEAEANLPPHAVIEYARPDGRSPEDNLNDGLDDGFEEDWGWDAREGAGDTAASVGATDAPPLESADAAEEKQASLF